jgi:hypothetical protein
MASEDSCVKCRGIRKCINSNIFVQEPQKRRPERGWKGASACHPERSEGSGAQGNEILRFAQDDNGGRFVSPRLMS